MTCPQQELKTIGDLVSGLTNDLKDRAGPVWFRGQAVGDWHLEPKLMRMNPQPSETHLLNRFKQNASLLLTQRPETEFGWLILMQHYGIPTRLLDWSESPLVALFFAVKEHEECSGALWALLPTALNQKSNFKPQFEFEVPSFDDEHLKNYLPDIMRSENRTSLNPMAAIAPRNSPRMQAQQGVFTITHRDNTYIEDIAGQTDHVWRYDIPADCKGVLKRELQLLGYNEFRLFPELDKLAKNIERELWAQ
jgi:hypothetical protein